MNCHANKSIECTVQQCAHHCQDANFCSLERILVVTHEADMVDRFHKRVIAINEGQIISDGMDGYFSYEEH